MMQSVAKFGTNAYRVSGPCDDLLQLLPDTLHLQGRIAFEQVWDYIYQLRNSTTRVSRFIISLLRLGEGWGGSITVGRVPYSIDTMP
jgi:hypothetical protein